jgi:hypothetical protein
MLTTQMTDFTNDRFESIKWQMQKADSQKQKSHLAIREQRQKALILISDTALM